MAARRSALTLIEVLVSVSILAIGAVTVSQALARVSQAARLSELQAAAYVFSLTKMAELDLAIGGGVAVEDAVGGGSFRVDQQEFTWAVSGDPLPEDASLQAVTLRVSWQFCGQTYVRRIDAWLRPPLAGAS